MSCNWRSLEVEARAALVGQRGGDRWLIEHPEVGAGWAARCRTDGVDVLVAHIGDVVVGYIVGVLGDDRIIRVDQVWVTPMARENGFGDALLEALISARSGRVPPRCRANRCRATGTPRICTNGRASWPA